MNHDLRLSILDWYGAHPHAWTFVLLVLAAITFSAPLIERKLGVRPTVVIVTMVLLLIATKELLVS